MELKGQNVLYHFTSEKNLFKYILKAKRLKFSSFENTNDPKEYMRFVPNISATVGKNYQYVSNWNTTIKRLEYFNIKKDIEIPNLNKNYSVLCFTRNEKAMHSEFDLGYGKPRMWAQYGSDHKGVCIILDKTEFDKNFKGLNIKKWDGPIDYSKQQKIDGIDIDFGSNLITEDDLSLKLEEFYKNNVENLLFRKSIDWKEENEYRYVVFNKNENTYISIGDSLRGIIFSNRMDKNKEKKLLVKAKTEKIDLYKIDWLNGYPKISDIKGLYIIDMINKKYQSIIEFTIKNSIYEKYINNIINSIIGGCLETQIVDFVNKHKDIVENYKDISELELYLENLNEILKILKHKKYL